MSIDNTKRIFLAVKPNLYWQKKISKIIATHHLSKIENTKCILADNFHITLHFWPDIGLTQIKIIMECTATVCNKFPAFNVQLTDLILFPSDNKPRVIAAKIEEADILRDFQRILGEHYLAQGIAIEHRTFKPHISLLRVFKKTTLVSPLIEKAFDAEAFPVEEIILFESNPQAFGSSYTPLAHFELG